MQKRWPFLSNFFIYAAYAAIVPLFVLYYQELGFSGTQIGLITGFSPLVLMISAPLWTNLADRTRKYNQIWGLLILLMIVIVLMFLVLKSFPAVFFLQILVNLVVGPFISFSDTAAMHMLGDEKEMYGRVRLGGTFGFGIMAAVVGWYIQFAGISSAFMISAVFFGLAFIVTRKLKFGTSDVTASGLQDGGFFHLLREPRWLLLFFVSLSSGIGIAATSTYYYPYMAELGASESLMGFSVLIATMAEVPVLFFGDRLFKRFTPLTLLLFAGLMTGLRLVLFGIVTSPTTVLFLQFFNGLTFILLWMSGVAYADKHAPENLKATVQGIFGSMNFGVGASIGGFIGGPLLIRMGGNGLFLVIGLIVTLATLFAVWFARNLKRKNPVFATAD